MNLSNKRFAEVFASLLPKGAGPNGGDRERRRAPRAELLHVTRVLIVGSRPMKSVEVTLRDVSVRGLKFTTGATLACGQQFILAVPQLNDEPVALLCTVVHADPSENGRYAIGAEFTLPLPTNDAASSRR